MTRTLLAFALVGCGGSPSFAARDLEPPGARHVAVTLAPTIARSHDWMAPDFCAKTCAPVLRPGEHVERCGRLSLEPTLANDVGRGNTTAVLCRLR